MTNLKDLTFDEVKELGASLEDFKADKRWGEKAYRENIELYLNENPGIFGEPEEEKPKAEPNPEKKPEKKSGKVKVQSKHRGKISSSVGIVDFGEDGIAEMPEEHAELFLQLEGYDKC